MSVEPCVETYIHLNELELHIEHITGSNGHKENGQYKEKKEGIFVFKKDFTKQIK